MHGNAIACLLKHRTTKAEAKESFLHASMIPPASFVAPGPKEMHNRFSVSWHCSLRITASITTLRGMDGGWKG